MYLFPQLDLQIVHPSSGSAPVCDIGYDLLLHYRRPAQGWILVDETAPFGSLRAGADA
jgi:hypothetical protein